MLKGLGCTRLRATTAKKVSCQVRTLGASAATRLGPTTHQRQPGGKAARLNKNQGTKVHAYFQDDEPEEVPLRYPDPEYIEETLKCFPDDGVASVEQGRVSQKTTSTTSTSSQMVFFFFVSSPSTPLPHTTNSSTSSSSCCCCSPLLLSAICSGVVFRGWLHVS